MTTLTEICSRELGNFLRRRREALSPSDAGITTLGPRRTPGLRRAEVAALANVSVAYYERLERGARGPMPSPDMLDAIARALLLSPEHRRYIYRLAEQAVPPIMEPGGSANPALASVLRAVTALIPAAVIDTIGTVLAQNAIHAELFGPMADFKAPRSNIVWRWFTEPDWRRRLKPADDHDIGSRVLAAELRNGVALRRADAETCDFLQNLLRESADFRVKWEQHEVLTVQSNRERFAHPEVGTIEVERTVMLSPTLTQRLSLLQPAVGTDAVERLARLNRLTLRQPSPAAADSPSNHGSPSG
ncbi:helix-turn-helix domain-containing protein [Actinoplanes sp. TBRC 11911]|uniref:helix-turn-helix domain-containing protein n=1 Tax=Actinoplanes sp. TBRC 11911 TaxID=2729386 RepID=UPI00145CA69D|nr:helix-turn-helix transcriptional regulator [Actinoplanes sp. TBRC 11911]NMO53677.1 helix-turn-helix domain-containing protein [Actinoplanes sp. TBRC 11911]